MEHDYAFTQQLDIVHDILVDAVHQGDGPLIEGKLRDLGELVTASKALLSLTPTQRRLLWEVVTMVDVDTLNDNLTRVGFGDEGMDTSAELERLGDVLDRDGSYIREWIALRPPVSE